MDSLQSIKTEFISLLNRYQPNEQDIGILQMTRQINLELLSWLKAQHTYPHFYLNLRDHTRKMAAIGRIRSFSELRHAQQYIEQQPLTLVGGLTFDGKTELFLPRLMLTQENDLLQVQLFIDHSQFEQEKQAILTLLETFDKTTALEPIKQPIQLLSKKASQQQWSQWVTQALTAIQQGEVSKLVLANETCFKTAEPLNAKDFLRKSEQYNLGCYHFLFTKDENCAFIGSTPERLYQREGNLLQTEALAGTALMTEDETLNRQQADWLLNDPKNIHENGLVAEDITQNLRPYIQKIEVSELGLKQLRQVQHLRQKIFAQLSEQNGDEACLKAIHPTAAVAGLPRQKAKQFLQQTENFERSWYAGTLGFMNKTQAEFCVTIRSAFIEQNKIRVFAGAGIVEGSIPLLEWQEIERKALGLISLLQE